MDRYVLPLNASPSLLQWNFHNRLECLSTIGIAMIVVFVLMGISKLPGQRENDDQRQGRDLVGRGE